MRRVRGLGLILPRLAGLLTGGGKRTGEPVMAGEGTSGVDESALEDSGEEIGVREAAEGVFAMPYNATYGWNPYSCRGMENQAVMQLSYEGLFTLNNSFEAEPVLCSEYTVDESGTYYSIQLKDAHFSNGKALTADDVVWSMDKAIEGDIYASRFVEVYAYSADAIDTVGIRLARPNDHLPALLTFPIIPSGTSPDRDPPGTGPFQRDGTTRLTVNTQWHGGPENLHIREVELHQSVSAEDTRDSFEIDAVHFVYNNPNHTTAATYHSDYELWNSRSTVMQYMGFNTEMGHLMAYDDIRRAITRCIDRVSIAESVYHNFADAAVLPVAPASGMYDEVLAASYAFTTQKAARQELSAAEGFHAVPENAAPTPSPSPTPEPLTEEEGEEDPQASPSVMTYNNVVMLCRTGNLKRVAAAKKVAQCLRDVGFTVTFKEYEDDDFYYNIRTGEYDIFYDEVMLKPDFDLRPLITGSLQVKEYPESEELSTLFDKALENSGNHYDLYKFLMDDAWLCPVLFINNAVFTTRGVFTGLDPTPGNLFYHIENVRINRD